MPRLPFHHHFSAPRRPRIYLSIQISDLGGHSGAADPKVAKSGIRDRRRGRLGGWQPIAAHLLSKVRYPIHWLQKPKSTPIAGTRTGLLAQDPQRGNGSSPVMQSRMGYYPTTGSSSMKTWTPSPSFPQTCTTNTLPPAKLRRPWLTGSPGPCGVCAGCPVSKPGGIPSGGMGTPLKTSSAMTNRNSAMA